MALSSLTAHRPTRHGKLLISLCLVLCAVCLLLDVGFAPLGQSVPTVLVPAAKASSPANSSGQRVSLGLPASRTALLIHQPLLTARHIHNLSFSKTVVSGQVITSFPVHVQAQDASIVRRDACLAACPFLNVQVANIPLLI